MYELAKVSATVTSHETLLPLLHGVIDAPSGRFREKPAPSRRPHCTLEPAGSFSACIFALDSERQMTSFRILCLMYLPEFFLHAKLCRPFSSMLAPQIQVYGRHKAEPNRTPTAILRVSSSINRPQLSEGIACIQSPECGADAASIRA